MDPFREMGGFAEVDIMEDFELVSRLRRRGRIVIAPLRLPLQRGGGTSKGIMENDSDQPSGNRRLLVRRGSLPHRSLVLRQLGITGLCARLIPNGGRGGPLASDRCSLF